MCALGCGIWTSCEVESIRACVCFAGCVLRALREQQAADMEAGLTRVTLPLIHSTNIDLVWSLTQVLGAQRQQGSSFVLEELPEGSGDKGWPGWHRLEPWQLAGLRRLTLVRGERQNSFSGGLGPRRISEGTARARGKASQVGEQLVLRWQHLRWASSSYPCLFLEAKE